MNKYVFLFWSTCSTLAFGQSYAPAADKVGTTAIKADSSIFIAWATDVEVTRGYINISDTTVQVGGSNRASAGAPENAIGPSNNTIVSLGDSGIAILEFSSPITNGIGPDFAVFENGFSHTFLELAHVEVSSDGINYVRFPSHSETQTEIQVNGFGALDATYIYNLAGKYKSGYGTPFDLEELKGSPNLDVEKITHVKIVDVVGSLEEKGTADSYGNKINDPFPTPFASGGFDLDAVGVIHQRTLGLTPEVINFNVYPNPSDGVINIDLKGFDAKEVTITNSLGKLVEQITISETNELLNLQLQKGVYFIHVKYRNEVSSKRIVIQ